MRDIAPAGVDPARLVKVAARLAITPRELLAVAARLAGAPDEPLDSARLEREIALARTPAAKDAVELLLLGYQSFALDDLDRALERLWSDRGTL